MKGDPSNPANWEKIARRDLASGHHLVSSGDSNMICFCAQQAAEKALKGWLIGQGWSLVKTHDLGRLALEAKTRGLDLAPYDAALLRLSRIYFSDRYVDESDEPEADADEAKSLIAVAQRIVDIIFPPTPLP